MSAALKPQGLLAVNCVSRSDAAFQAAVSTVQAGPLPCSHLIKGPCLCARVLPACSWQPGLLRLAVH